MYSYLNVNINVVTSAGLNHCNLRITIATCRLHIIISYIISFSTETENPGITQPLLITKQFLQKFSFSYIYPLKQTGVLYFMRNDSYIFASF